MMALDGVYAEDKKGCICFHLAPPPSDAEVARVAKRIQRRVARLLEPRGLGPQANRDESDRRHPVEAQGAARNSASTVDGESLIRTDTTGTLDRPQESARTFPRNPAL
jgi:hypothetical protein